MALSDKNLVITPNIGSTTDDPKIVFSAASSATSATIVTLRAYTATNGTLSFEGSAGQLFSVGNNVTGTIFAVSDAMGIPSIEVLDTGLVKLAQYSSYVKIYNTVSSVSTTTGALVVGGGVGIASTLTIAGTLYNNGQATSLNNQYNGVKLGVVSTYNFSTGTTASIVNSVLSIRPITPIGDVAPLSPTNGLLWWDSSAGNLRIYYSDADSSQWVDASPANYSVQSITAGTDTVISARTGQVTIQDTSTLQSITNRGFTSTSAINITNTASSTSTLTGALIVTGGVGVGSNAFIRGKIIIAHGYEQGTGQLQVKGNAALAGTSTIQTLNLQGGTNLFAYSQNMSLAPWGGDRLTRTQVSITAPDGSSTSTSIIPTVAATNGVLAQAGPTINGIATTVSLYAKAAGFNFIAFGANNGGASVCFDLINGVIARGTGVITSAGNGWWRVAYNSTDFHNGNQCYIAVSEVAADTNLLTADGIKGLYVWGAQAETGTTLTSYTPTTSTAIVTANNLLIPNGGIFISSTLTSTSTTTGALTVAGGVGIGGALNVSTTATFSKDLYNTNNFYWSTTTTQPIISDVLDLDDESFYTDGFTNSFTLTYNQNTATITSPFQLLVTVNGAIQPAFDLSYDTIWFGHLLTASKGYTIDLSGNLKFADCPSVGSQVLVRTVGSVAQTHVKKVYPFKPADILLGF